MNEELDGIAQPCQPIGCDNGHHLPGCIFEEVDRVEQEISAMLPPDQRAIFNRDPLLPNQGIVS